MGKFLLVFFGGLGIGFCAAMVTLNPFVGIGATFAVWLAPAIFG